MCNAADIMPIVTTTAEATISGHPMTPDEAVLCCDPTDMADLVEVMLVDACGGDAR